MTPGGPGNAEIYEIRHKDGTVVPKHAWDANGFDEHTLEELEAKIFTWHGESERDSDEAAAEAKADAAREDRD